MKYIVKDIKKGSLEGKSVCLPISLPLNGITLSFWGSKIDEQRDRIKSFFEYLVESACGSITVIVACELQRFAVMNAKNCSEEDALRIINKEKPAFMDMIYETIESYKNSGIKIEVQDWVHQKQLEKYSEQFNRVTDMYYDNADYRNKINNVAIEFQKHYNRSKQNNKAELCIENNIKHVIEELSVLALWSFHVILHPVGENEAMQMTRDAFDLPYDYYKFKLGEDKKSSVIDAGKLLVESKDSQQIIRSSKELQKAAKQVLDTQKKLEEQRRKDEQKMLEEQKKLLEEERKLLEEKIIQYEQKMLEAQRIQEEQIKRQEEQIKRQEEQMFLLTNLLGTMNALSMQMKVFSDNNTNVLGYFDKNSFNPSLFFNNNEKQQGIVFSSMDIFRNIQVSEKVKQTN